MDLTNVLRSAAGMTTDYLISKELSREESIEAIRAIESMTLQAAPLQGLPNLSTTLVSPWYGARVRATIDKPLHRVDAGKYASQPALCLSAEGRLVLARMQREPYGFVPWWIDAGDEILIAEDLAHLVRTVINVVEIHNAACREKTAKFEELRALAAKVRGC